MAENSAIEKNGRKRIGFRVKNTATSICPV
jgi:hypothetical protein